MGRRITIWHDCIKRNVGIAKAHVWVERHDRIREINTGFIRMRDFIELKNSFIEVRLIFGNSTKTFLV